MFHTSKANVLYFNWILHRNVLYFDWNLHRNVFLLSYWGRNSIGIDYWIVLAPTRFFGKRPIRRYFHLSLLHVILIILQLSQFVLSKCLFRIYVCTHRKFWTIRNGIGSVLSEDIFLHINLPCDVRTISVLPLSASCLRERLQFRLTFDWVSCILSISFEVGLGAYCYSILLLPNRWWGYFLG